MKTQQRLGVKPNRVGQDDVRSFPVGGSVAAVADQVLRRTAHAEGLQVV